MVAEEEVVVERHPFHCRWDPFHRFRSRRPNLILCLCRRHWGLRQGADRPRRAWSGT